MIQTKQSRQTALNSDKIIFMVNRKIVEQGIHNELMDKNGRYANMIRLQYGDTSVVSNQQVNSLDIDQEEIEYA
ncbi:hypothetical protein [Enterococcus sp. BWB1-3]|uniref:hypothetical protein n=1 Tax=Enterococcus sp. BWB1-3 TaxID=2787713 RepID=UPI001924D45B|nr:hypothetical protein [Enterococcus sp. BWB1-3]